MSDTGYIYLASPYSHPDPTVRRSRERRVSKIGFKLMREGKNLFCPITQSHRLNDFSDGNNLTHDECMRVDYEFLERAKELYVLMIPGWEKSVGVELEIDYAMQNHIPISWLDENGEVVRKFTATGTPVTVNVDEIIEAWAAANKDAMPEKKVLYSFDDINCCWVHMLPGWDTDPAVEQGIEDAIQRGMAISFYDENGDSIMKSYREGDDLRADVNAMKAEYRANNDARPTHDGDDWENEAGKTEGWVSQGVGVKDSAGKARVSLVPYAALEAIARVRDFGDKKYGSSSAWYGFDDKLPEFVEAAQRHLAKYQDATLYNNRSVDDEESGLNHLDHAITSLALAIALRDKSKGTDK